MKHLFVINPKAGKKDHTKDITAEIKKYLKEDQYDIHITTKTLEARDFVKNYCQEHQSEELRIYSCGGDGTLNEVTNGAFGYKNVSVACYPSGSGNDFIKYFGTAKHFLNIENLINGDTVDVDLMKHDDRYILNICNMGFDANVAIRRERFKRLPLFSGKGAYIAGVAVSLLSKLTHNFKVTIDDEIVHDGDGLLAAVANAICYGGGFYCAPRALVDDGLIDVCIVRKVSRIPFIKLIKFYKKGTHLDEPKLQRYIGYKKGKTVTVESEIPLNYAIDGELGVSKKITITIVPKSLKFVIPKCISENK